jgi:phage-related protein
VSAVKNMLRAEAQKLLDSGCDLPTVTLDVDFINVKDTVEYAAYTPLTDIFIGDAVTVIVRN